MKAVTVKGVTSTGFKYDIDPANLDDFYLLELFGKSQNGDVSALSSLMERMLGEDQKAALLKHCEDEKGRARMSRIGDEIADIYNGLIQERKVKNS